ncbi:uncharacterized protein LOC123397467 [Hordeum vulgare subsp. vulgare]|uniref:Uncharacterized protein n=1 Tax=Hordeum vulgare subsp. vulgare TaxID=112509 RepID=A0A8I6XVX9_HORVV|nr:uncharacterized protein LOC123397464 [Hordeum vulgare subsp. vulgare]XP_044947925.1 uncharacterized protein LOC123397465 [Hordeum vulgare subsp. vulgare]XP_044947926.1 uncharacterized protein LOC123397466 [Hordeum vulgare subsp. vulgare]XP_044947928.1 uncharacterized protein LOC123397467 [Hordeum vulgare subsp. vulgare]
MLSLAWTRRAVVEVEAPPTPTPTPTWGGCSLHGLDIEVVREKDAVPGGGGSGLVALAIPSYFSGPRLAKRQDGGFPLYTGYSAARSLVGKGAMTDLRRLSREAEDMLAELFASIDGGGGGAPNKNKEDAVRARPRVVQLRLSPELALWKSTQHAIGNMLPTKGAGLIQATPQVLALLGATDWPEAMKTTNALSGSGMANLLIGASDVRTLFSNYVVDMAFYYEHGYHKAFPSFSRLLHDGLADARSLRTPGGRQRREAVAIGASYIRAKIALEAAHKTLLKDRSAQMDRRAAQVISLCESSILGMGAEAIARGFDVGAVTSDLVFSSPGTDVIDVGSDLVNSEVMNSFLNVADIAASGVVSEPALRAIYDAYAATGARMYTQRWHEPVARMCITLYTWHLHNDRHMFLRRALLGWPKARKSPAQPQREADFDEVFDTDFRTTGFSRPLDLEYACNGEETCDHVRRFLKVKLKDQELLAALWSSIVTGPLEYVRKGEVDEQREKHLIESSRLQMVHLFSKGLIDEMVWLVAHASHHAWQVNYLFEAAMFGSILDGGAMIGKLDRAEED